MYSSLSKSTHAAEDSAKNNDSLTKGQGDEGEQSYGGEHAADSKCEKEQGTDAQYPEETSKQTRDREYQPNLFGLPFLSQEDEEKHPRSRQEQQLNDDQDLRLRKRSVQARPLSQVVKDFQPTKEAQEQADLYRKR